MSQPPTQDCYDPVRIDKKRKSQPHRFEPGRNNRYLRCPRCLMYFSPIGLAAHKRAYGQKETL